MLYVDDEIPLLEVGKSFLEQTNEFAVTTTTSVLAALGLMKDTRFQAIVSDYQMPGKDGIAFLKQVRAVDKTIPFILFTGRGREEIAIEAFENGADFYLQKGGAPTPQFAELMHKIKTAVGHRHADAEVAALHRVYSVLSATNKAIVRVHDKKELLNEICRIVVGEGGFTMAWAGIADPLRHRIDPVAMAGQWEGYLDAISISTDDIPLGRGPTGTAFRKGTFNICNDIENAPKMAPWRKESLTRGFRSLAAFPFAQGTGNAGVMTYFASEPGFFTDSITRLLEEQVMDISFAIETLDHEEQRLTAEKDLEKSEIRYRRLFETAQDAILILDGDTGEIIDANKFILDMLGYPLEDFIGKHLWELGFLQDKSFAKKAFAELQADGYIRYEDLPLESKQGKAMSVEFISNVYLEGDKRIIQCNIRDITDRKVAQGILQESESRYRRLFETAQDGILILDGASGKIIDANRFIIDMLGYPLEYFVGRQLWELGFIKDKAFAKSAFSELKEDGYIRYEDLPLETKNGDSIDVEFVSNTYLVNLRKIIQCNIRDNTERKLAEEAQVASEMRYRRLFETAQDGILILDADTGQIVEVNPFIIAMLGFSREQFLGKKIWEIGLFKDIVANKDNFGELQRKEYMRYEDLPLETADGRKIAVEFVSNVYMVNNKKVIQCNIRDITLRKSIEEVLRLKNEELDGYFTNTLDLLGILDLDGHFRRLNREWESALGYSPAELEGKQFIDFIHPDDLGVSLGALKELAAGKQVLQFSNRYRHKDGTFRWFEWRLFPAGNIIYASARDITERKKIADLIEASLAEKETLLREIHHRVKNNLQIISSLLNLQIRKIDDPKTIEVLKDGQARVMSMALVHEHLYKGKDFSRIDLKSYIHSLEMQLSQSYGNPGEKVRFSLAVPDIFVDINTAIPLGLIINELITNSLKYAFRGRKEGNLSITAVDNPQFLTLTVEDDGVGIPASITLENQTSLGLRLVKTLTGQLHGTVVVGREGGTKFTFTIPKGAEQRPETVAVAGAAP